ncbi:hypothetical protein ANCCEY_11120 [Ancylostoma ceylanicum]|uniref:Uncharacterized protein n=1 Tax=Ancylostoma ceylanicum TaxID=53326 RepID=A0A0D6LD43_9BILA|nr:hypothetical protein ANCCEY_11120 [Ancylostoma ceylanicum]
MFTLKTEPQIGSKIKFPDNSRLPTTRPKSAIGGGVDIYKAGKMPCKPCPSGTACSKLGGLCEATP